MTPQIGLIVSKEYAPISNVLQSAEQVRRQTEIKYSKTNRITGYSTKFFSLYVLRSAIGEISAAAATRTLIDFCDPEIIVNFGMATQLSNKVSYPNTYVVKNVIHYDFDVSSALSKPSPGTYPQYRSHLIPTSTHLVDSLGDLVKDYPLVTCASGDRFIITKDDKNRLLSTFSADICDMNSAGTLVVCDEANIPCLIIKGVTDGIHNGAFSGDISFDNAAASSFRHAFHIIEHLAQNL